MILSKIMLKLTYLSLTRYLVMNQLKIRHPLIIRVNIQFKHSILQSASNMAVNFIIDHPLFSLMNRRKIFNSVNDPTIGWVGIPNIE
jgi:hypothetical protein